MTVVRASVSASAGAGSGAEQRGLEPLARSLAECLVGDVREAAQALHVAVDDVRVDVTLTVEDGRVSGATVDVAATGGQAERAVRRALETSVVLAAVRHGFPVSAGTEAGAPGAPGEPEWLRRQRRERVFGDVLPETTADERSDRRGGGTGDDWLRSQVPPHHGD